MLRVFVQGQLLRPAAGAAAAVLPPNRPAAAAVLS
jgi:hypothetical protein